MRINTELGYEPVTFAKLTDDEAFWAGCKSCVNYDVLQRTNLTKCLCTGMIYDPVLAEKKRQALEMQSKSHEAEMLKLEAKIREQVKAEMKAKSWWKRLLNVE